MNLIGVIYGCACLLLTIVFLLIMVYCEYTLVITILLGFEIILPCLDTFNFPMPTSNPSLSRHFYIITLVKTLLTLPVLIFNPS